MIPKHIKNIIILFMIFTLTLLPIYSKLKKSSDIKYSKIVVCPGDTLWSIAEKYGDESSDIRKTIYDIQEINSLNSPIIMPGQVILVPEK